MAHAKRDDFHHLNSIANSTSTAWKKVKDVLAHYTPEDAPMSAVVKRYQDQIGDLLGALQEEALRVEEHLINVEDGERVYFVIDKEPAFSVPASPELVSLLTEARGFNEKNKKRPALTTPDSITFGAQRRNSEPSKSVVLLWWGDEDPGEDPYNFNKATFFLWVHSCFTSEYPYGFSFDEDAVNIRVERELQPHIKKWVQKIQQLPGFTPAS